MSKKIGQALVERQLITRRQLRTALELQLIHGGHLGSSLIELGYLDEASLGRTLAEIQNLPYAPREMFIDIPSEILAALPIGLVRERSVLPIGLENRSLHVATIDRRNVEGLSTITGYKIVPYLAPEGRIVQGLEQYYGIPRRARYLRVSAQPCRQAEAKKDSADATSTESGPPPVVNNESEFVRKRLQEISQRMSQVTSHSELGEVILDFSAGTLRRCILFDASGEQAGIANWRGVDLPGDRARCLSIPIDPDSIFALALEDSWYYRGALPEEFDHRSFYDALGIDPPNEVLVLPIYGAERLEAVLYGDGGESGQIDEPTECYLALLDRIDVALRMLALRSELCSL